jgi:hypothetical protein
MDENWELIRRRCRDIGPLSAHYLLEVVHRVQSKYSNKSISPSMSHYELHLLNGANTKLVHVHPPIAGRPVATLTLFHRASVGEDFRVIGEFNGSDIDRSFEVLEGFLEDL